MSWRVNRLVLAGGACVEVNRGAVQLVVRVLDSRLDSGLRLPQSRDRCRLCARKLPLLRALLASIHSGFPANEDSSKRKHANVSADNHVSAQ